MIIACEAKVFDDVIRQLRGEPNLSEAQLTLRSAEYAGQVWQHLSEYGAHFAGIVSSMGVGASQIAMLRFNLSGYYQARQRPLDGLAIIQPISCAVEPQDLNLFIDLPTVRQLFEINWEAISGELENISLGAVLDKIESAAMHLYNLPGAFNPNAMGDADLQFATESALNGIQAPDAMRRQQEINQEIANEQRRKKELEAIERRFDMGGNSLHGGWGVREV